MLKYPERSNDYEGELEDGTCAQLLSWPGRAAYQRAREIADEMMDYRGCGMSVLEMSHRSSMYQQIIDDVEATLRRLLSIPDNYRVLFLQGGATLQFAGIPMNLMRRGRAGYIVTGNFANKAYKEAAKYGEAVLLASSKDTNFDRIPTMADVNARIAAEAASNGLDYVYICQNNTIFGTMYHELPNCGDVPLVADVSSCFLSQPLDVERYGLIYAGAQKNAGAAGVTVVIVRDDLIADGSAFAQTPQYMDLKAQAAKGSMLNTPNTFGIYVCGKVFRWVEKTGGLAAMAERNWAKANLLYDLLEHSELFHSTTQADSRSIANVTFRTGDAELDAAFVAGAAGHQIQNVKGHRLVGGMRASVYNAVTMEDVQALASYMKDFEAQHSLSPRSN